MNIKRKEIDIINITNTLYEAARKYKENLLNKNIMFIFKDKKDNKLYYIETFFSRKNFLHLTGLIYKKTAREFFSECLNKTISKQDISIKSKKYTKSKLKILENAMSIGKVSNRIGDFNNNGTNLMVDKVLGGTNYCMGFSNKEKNKKLIKYYYPKSLLKADIRKYTIEDNRIIVILSKQKNEKLYSQITYLSKNIKFLEVLKFSDIISKINYKEIKKQVKY